MAFIVVRGGRDLPEPAHRMVEEPPVDPVRAVILILAVAFFVFMVWVFWWR